MSLNSGLYECDIWHERTEPRRHAFNHRHFMFYLDLAELNLPERETRLFSSTRATIFSFRDSDYLPQTGGYSSLADRVKDIAASAGIAEQIENIRLITNVRTFGFIFNPISFFFCFDKNERPVCCICEVGNTFWEKKAYVLHPQPEGGFMDRQQKLFYVSPFTQLDQDFLFNLHAPKETINFQVDTMQGESTVITSGIRGKYIELTDGNLLRLSLRYPLAPLRVLALIHFQAMKLWLKGVPHHLKEDHADQQVGVMHPHHSLSERFES